MVRLEPDEDVMASVTPAKSSTRVPVPHPDEQVKAMNLLIHDLRAPLSVAQGYLRLLQQNRLEAEADRTRAITQSMEALGRIARLCEEAAAFAAEPADAAGPVMRRALSEFVAHLAENCTARCSPVTFVVEQEVSGTVAAVNLERLIESLAVVLCAARRSTQSESVRVSVQEEEKEARFLLGSDEERAALMSGPPQTFDPWRGGHGLALPLACRTIAQAGGRIWTTANRRGVVGIAIPEEASAP